MSDRSTAQFDDVVSLTERLIAIESHCEGEQREAEVARYLVAWFRGRGIDVETRPVLNGRSNVIARVRGGDGPSLMLCGHMDTVPAGEMADAFTPRIDEDGFLWGRGACDMKGAVAAMACTLVEVERAHEGRPASLAGDLLFVGTVDEETGGLGVKGLIDDGIRTDYAVVGEPTGLRVTLAHKGACFVRITLLGRGAHGSRPETGVSAISYAAKIVRSVEEGLRSQLARRTHPLLGSPTISVGRVCGGTQPNIVAERCEIEIDRRTVPGDEDPLGEIESIVEEICAGVDGLRTDVVELPMTSVVPHTPLETSEASPIAEAALAASALVTGSNGPLTPVGVTYWTDGGHLAANGIETIILGPGDIADAHGPRERVRIEELETAVRIYGEVVRRVLG